MTINQEHLTLIGRAVSRLAFFHKKLMQDKRYADKARSMYPNLVNKEDDYGLLIYDLIKCYKGLGHDMDISSNESIGLVLLISKSFDKIDSISSRLDVVLGTIRSQYNTVVSSVSPQVDSLPKGYDFLVGTVLSELKQTELRKQYYVLLFRLSSLISKIDGIVDESESQWLAALLNVSEGKAYAMHSSAFVDENKVKENKEVKNEKEEKVDQKEQGNTELLPIQNRMKESEAIKELDSLIGLSGVKEQIHSLMNYSMVQIMRESRGMKKIPLSLHCVFSGNPGTGKTTVARLIGRIYHDLGLLETGELVETDRAGLVAEYIGQTAAKTNDVIDSALGGVLFIDEAYSLIGNSKDDYGHEAISTLLKRMEDERDRLVVILAGYTENMQKFIESNPGLQSRFSRKIIFEDYTAEELLSIYTSMLTSYEYSITEDAKNCIKAKFDAVVQNKEKDFGNGRFARNLFEKTLEFQASRVAFLPNVNEEVLSSIILEDVERL